MKAFDTRKERLVMKREQTHAFLNKLEPGTILWDSWGWEQTNVEFYQVIERKGSLVQIVELCHKTIPGSEGFMSDRVVPGDQTQGEPIWKMVRGPRITINDSVSLKIFPEEYKTNGVHRSWYA